MSIFPSVKGLVDLVHVFRPYCLFVNAISYPTSQDSDWFLFFGYVDISVNDRVEGGGAVGFDDLALVGF